MSSKDKKVERVWAHLSDKRYNDDKSDGEKISKHDHRKDKKKSCKEKKKKSKKKKSHQHSSSSSSNEESDDELELLKRLEEEKERIKEAQREKKKFLKSTETLEEKRQRRLNKKEAKERKLKEKMGWDDEYLHFTNEDNPYGDSNLLETFTWKKKYEKEGLNHLTKEEIQQRNRSKMEENRLELEKVKKRRLEREQERAEREKLLELEMRMKEAAQFSEFSKQEGSFQLEQARIRSRIRIQDGRAKPIDLLAQYVNSDSEVSAVDMVEPYTHLRGLTLKDLEDLIEDIKVYQKLEKEDHYQTYWSDLSLIVHDELRRLRQRDPKTRGDAMSQRQGIHASISEDVSKVFVNKSAEDLDKLRINIEKKLSGHSEGVDVAYWESLLSQLKAHQARARLKEQHRENLKLKLNKLKAEQGVTEPPEKSKKEYSRESPSDSDEENVPEGSQDLLSPGDAHCSSDKDREVDDPESGDAILSGALAAYDSGRFSPKLISAEDLEPGTVIVEPEEDELRIQFSRDKVLSKSTSSGKEELSQVEKDMKREAQLAMSTDEAQFSVEAQLDTKKYLWADKYRPRKPRYFNRVHTGFEWNKYNQTHYDMDNPPPKIVQGYKFNIFYPDLIDKKKTPQYQLVPCAEQSDFSIVKFMASPPYEDIAFKIVNREWEYSYKRGYRCQFYNNVFQLWFHFKRYRYRR